MVRFAVWLSQPGVRHVWARRFRWTTLIQASRTRGDGISPVAHVRAEVGHLVKVVPTSLDGRGDAAVHHRRRTSCQRIDALLDTLRAARAADLGVTEWSGPRLRRRPNRLKLAVSWSAQTGHFRVREHNILRYYARSMKHLVSPAGPTH